MIINVTTYQGTTVSVDTERKVVTTKTFGDLPYTGISTAVMQDKTPVYTITTSKGPVAITKVSAEAAYHARYNKIANS